MRRRRVLVILTVVFAMLGGWAITPRGSTYSASASLYVGSRSIDLTPGSGEIGADRAAGLSFLASSFADIIDTRTVAATAIAEGDLPLTIDEAEDAITATATSGSLLVVVDVVHSDPDIAARLADAVADTFVTLVRDQENSLSLPSDADAPAPVSVFEHASVPTTPNPSPLARNLTLSMIFGLLLAVGVVVLLEYLDLTIRSADDAQRRLQLPVLGAIPMDSHLARG
jgi:capsular polysaccharide biosynthesis protein